jgi:glutathione S-transferase
VRAIEEMNGLKLLDVVKTPLLSAWAENFCENEAVKSVLPETLKLVEYAKGLHSRFQGGPPVAK